MKTEDKGLKEKKISIVKDALAKYLQKKNYRNTPERFAVVEEIYSLDHHFNVDDLYLEMVKKKYQVSKATIYNTIEMLLEAGFIRRHQFSGKAMSSTSFSYEKSYFDRQHDHLVIYESESNKDISEIIEFCDPRIQVIRESIEELFGVEIESHSLYFYGYKKKK